MKFTEALNKLMNYGRCWEGTDSMFCITNDIMLLNNEVYVIDFYGLRKLKVDFENNKYNYTQDNLVKSIYLENPYWHLFTTWHELKEFYMKCKEKQ